MLVAEENSFVVSDSSYTIPVTAIHFRGELRDPNPFRLAEAELAASLDRMIPPDCRVGLQVPVTREHQKAGHIRCTSVR